MDATEQGVNRPLWQILFALSYAALAVQRVIVGHLTIDGSADPALVATWALVVAFAAATAVGVWIERSWAVATLVGTGVLLVVATLQQVWLGTLPVAASVSEMSIVALITGALALALRHGERHPANEPVERDAQPEAKPSQRDGRSFRRS